MFLINRDMKSNYHTHTVYCDGKDTPAEMAGAAFALGFSALGFSGHEWAPACRDYAMTREKEALYRQEIRALREQYAGRMEVWCGIERDYLCEPEGAFDYVIGSVHHVVKDGEEFGVDHTPEILRNGIDTVFGGDAMEMVRAYYRMEAEALRKTGGQIVGHFDLVTKFNEDGRFFDESSEEYKEAALEALHTIVKYWKQDHAGEVFGDPLPPVLAEVLNVTGLPIFEINTGAMARGYRTKPYPAHFLLQELDALGVPVLLSSDCHDRRNLLYGFEDLVKQGEILAE